ncbi:MAG: sugar transferase [Armatimonadota bacterium]
MGSMYPIAKRVLDVVVAASALVLCAPLMAIVSLLIKLTSPGPLIFVQDRVGLNGRHFNMYKFRSMATYAEEVRGSLAAQNEIPGPVFKIRNDPRVTPVGRFLRKASIDELPQLVNVLKGEMSLVGPRPPVPEEVAQYEPWQMRRLDVKPGLTCIWQVSGRSHILFDEWVRMDIEYVEKQSFWLDLKLLLLTIPAVITGRGAY